MRVELELSVPCRHRGVASQVKLPGRCALTDRSYVAEANSSAAGPRRNSIVLTMSPTGALIRRGQRPTSRAGPFGRRCWALEFERSHKRPGRV